MVEITKKEKTEKGDTYALKPTLKSRKHSYFSNKLRLVKKGRTSLFVMWLVIYSLSFFVEGV